jgi:hypothetical protein
MRHPLRSAATGGVGVFLLAGAVLAIAERAAVPAAVFAAAGLVHVALAAGLARGSAGAAIAGAAVGLADLALVGVGMAFIVGIETGIGVDLADRWFAPLNGYATIAVAVGIAIVAVSLVRAGIDAVRTAAALPALRG